MIPYGRQCIEDDDINAVADALRADMLTGGLSVNKFETTLCKKVEAPHAVACSNGTAALHLAAMALNLGSGDAVIVPSVTFLASANMARYVGADVWFCDVDPLSGLMTAESLEQAIKRGGPGIPKAVIVVHLNGQSADMIKIHEVATRYSLEVIEDAAHALGGSYKHSKKIEKVGSSRYSSMTCFSFHPVKLIAMGEGGAITTQDPELDARLRRFRNHGIERDASLFINKAEAFNNKDEPNSWFYEMEHLGYNYRVSDINCVLGISQLNKLDRFLERRFSISRLYDQMLSEWSPLVQPISRAYPKYDGWHLYPVLIDFDKIGLSRSHVMEELRNLKIGTQVHYIPVHHQPYYKNLYPNTFLPGADSYYRSCLSLPIFFGLEDEQISYVVNSLQRVLEKKPKPRDS